jgi:hypothetical protein
MSDRRKPAGVSPPAVHRFPPERSSGPSYDQAIRDRRNNALMVHASKTPSASSVSAAHERRLASVQVPEEDILQRFIRQNVTMEGQAFFDIQPPRHGRRGEGDRDDLRRYYNEHADEVQG